MELSEKAQEVLELLWIATEEDGDIGLPRTKAPEHGVAEITGEGLATWQGDWLVPTETGREEARKAIRRHRLGERLLVDLLMTEESLVEDQACRLEHALFDGIDDSICTLLGHPRFCPHGKPIPRGKCCKEGRDTVHPLVSSLSQMEPGQHGHIAYIQMNNPNRLQKLMSMGVLPGVPVRLLQRSPSYVFEAGFSQFAVDEEIATAIYVRLVPEE